MSLARPRSSGTSASAQWKKPQLTLQELHQVPRRQERQARRPLRLHDDAREHRAQDREAPQRLICLYRRTRPGPHVVTSGDAILLLLIQFLVRWRDAQSGGRLGRRRADTGP